MPLPLLLNQAVHHFDVMRFVLDETPEAVVGETWDPGWNGADGPTCAEATFIFPGRRQDPLQRKLRRQGDHDELQRACGAWREAAASCSLTEQEQVVFHNGETRETLFAPSHGGPRPEVRLCKDFLTAVRTGGEAPTGGEDNLRTLAMVFALEISAREGRMVRLAELLGQDKG